MKTTERIFDAITGETTEVERDMTADELKEHTALLEQIEKENQERASAETKRALAHAKLEALGLTADDLKALGL
jgi:DNA-binding GntR family transcriptional regulator